MLKGSIICIMIPVLLCVNVYTSKKSEVITPSLAPTDAVPTATPSSKSSQVENPILYTPNPAVYIPNKVMDAEVFYNMSEEELLSKIKPKIQNDKIYKKNGKSWNGKEYIDKNRTYIVINGMVVRHIFSDTSGSFGEEDYSLFNMIGTRPEETVEKIELEETKTTIYRNVNSKIQEARFENMGNSDPNKCKIVITYDMRYFED